MDAATLLRQARTDAGMTQVELARAAGTSQSTLAAYESGSKSPNMRTLERIVRAAGATISVHLEPAPKAQGRLLEELRGHAVQIRRAARTRRIWNVRVFGSAARGEETTSSDVDLLVDFDAARYGVIPLAGFAQEVASIVGRSVDATTVDLLREPVRLRALSEAVPL